ncbi:esterase/lipase family protein [Prosthecobacter vanneervenii]|uniref:HTH domain-containing protein n=1 Tax=Prosthecobacter vanneervenii TaxID=48466 RepID=A0A7W7YAQ6_9BACT|nr:hypothetical protein [Prosthecobacter vanneervenii]MBB5032752.1 hypothetical protein [Prosthecobacter vanneervenii]
MKLDSDGVHQIANTDRGDRVADIIFVHGLGGKSHSTWRTGKPGARDHFFWPEELAKAMPQCGVWSVGYSAGFTELGRPGMIIEKRALNLVQQLSLKGIGTRPSIFITHSMGGLLIKSLIVASAWAGDNYHKQLVKSIRGIIFCGTPHRGSALASVADYLGVTQKHVKQMRGNTDELDLVHDRFISWYRENPIAIESYAEAHALYRQTFFGRLFPRLLVVPRTSANPNIGNIHDVDADHLTLVKPSLGSIVYEGTLRFINEIISAIPKSEIAPLSHDSLDQVIPSTPLLKLSTFDSFSSDLVIEREQSLRDVQHKISCGHLAAAETELRSIMARRGTWEPLPTATKAKTYRLLIEVTGNRQQNTDDARQILADAKLQCADQRFVTSEALLAILEGSEKEMLESYPVPLSEEEWRWKMMLLINCNRHTEAIKAISDPAAPFPINPALQSILTWAYLGLKNIEAAKTSNNLAIKNRPDSLGNLEAKAIIKYFDALSPHATGWLELGFPIPMEPECIKTNSEAKKLFEEAAGIFQDLAQRSDKGSFKQIKYLTWCLAAWCNLARTSHVNNSQARENASKIFEQIFLAVPTSSAAIHWALVANLPFDRKACEEALSSELNQGKIEAVEVFVQLLLDAQNELEAANILDHYADSYITSEAKRVWRYYRSQLAASLGQTDILSTLINGLDDENERGQLTALARKHDALKGRDAEECLRAYILLWEKTHKLTDLYSACEMHVNVKKPEFVIVHTKDLLEAFPSRMCLMLVLHAHVIAKKWQSCLDLIDKNHHLVPDLTADLDLLRIKCDSLYKTGRFSQALQNAGLIAQQTHDKEDRFSWFEFARKAGDREQMFNVANLAQADPNTPAEHRLYIADQVAPLNPEQAKSILESVATIPDSLNPSNAAQTFLVASKLGMEAKLDPTVMKTAVAPGGHLVAYSFDEMVKIMRENQRANAEAEEKYRFGHIPVHAYVNSVNRPISAIIHDACPPAVDGFFAPPTQLWSARIRHGRRHTFADPPKGEWKLFLDITSLLLAHRLGVLPILEKTTAEITLSPNVPGLLLQELARLKNHQPSREENSKELIKLVDAAKIGVTSQTQTEIDGLEWAVGMTVNWRRAFSAAVELNGVLIDFWPLDWETEPNRLLDVPSDFQKHLSGPRGLVQGMIEAGWVEEIEANKRILNNSTFLSHAPTIRLTNDSVIILDPAIAGCLIDVDLLHDLSSRCKVLITYQEQQTERTKLRHAKYRDEIIASVDQLQMHVKQQEEKRFRIGIASSLPSDEDNSALFRCMVDLTAASREEGTIFVIEDRWLNGFSDIEKAPIVGFLDVLYWLHKEEKISAAIFYGCLHRVRLGNAKYIPLIAEELLWQLRKSTNLHSKTLKESSELEVIRRYYAACLLDARAMQIAPNIDQGRTEITFSIHVHNVAVEVMADLWICESDTKIRYAKALWICQALVTDVGSLSARVINPHAQIAGFDRWLQDLFCIFCLRISSKMRLLEMPALIGDFASWLIAALKLHQSVYRHFFKSVRHMIKDMTKKCTSSKEKQYIAFLAKSVVSGLLPKGAAYLPFNADELKQLELINVQRFGSYLFNRNEAWEAIEKSMSGKVSMLTSVQDNKIDFKLTRLKTTSSRPVISFESETCETWSLSDKILMLLSPDASVRKKYLEQTGVILGFTQTSIKNSIKTIAATASPSVRVEQFVEWENSSVNHQFKQILQRWPDGNVYLGDLLDAARPQGTIPLLQHVGIGRSLVDSNDLHIALTQQSEIFISELGFVEAFSRYGSLPIKLPDLWRKALFALPQEELHTLLSMFEDPYSSPLHRLHLGCLLLHPDSPDQTNGLTLLRGLTGSNAKDIWNFFQSILSWSWRVLNAARQDLDTEMNLLLCSWLHAGLFHIHLSRPPESASLLSQIKDFESQPQQYFEVFNVVSTDVAKPAVFNARWMLAHVLPKVVPINDLPEWLANDMRKLYVGVLFQEPDSPLPKHSVMQLRSEWGNRLGSFLNPLDATFYEGWLKVEQTSFIDQSMLLSQLRALCTDVSVDDIASKLVMISGVCGLQVAPPSLHEDLSGVIQNISFNALKVTDPIRLWGIACFIFKQSNWFKPLDEDFWNKLLKSYLDEAQSLKDEHFSEHAIEAALTISFRTIDETKNAACFAENVVWIVRNWPLIAVDTWRQLSFNVLALPHTLQGALWPMLAELRALAGSDPTHRASA